MTASQCSIAGCYHRRWERSRPSTISHIPVHSAISSIYLMPSHTLDPTASPALLTASLQYGVVARSYPLVGKILRGHFDASGTLNGLGIGNPNAEFSPDVTHCAMTADGGTARIAWGFRNGDIAVTVAQKAMESARPTAARWFRCSPTDAHDGVVERVIWVDGHSSIGGGFFVTGGADGRVKLWHVKGVACLWTSELQEGQFLRDPCVEVVADSQGAIAAAFKSGTVVVWTGLGSLYTEERKTVITPGVKEIRISPPNASGSPSPYGQDLNRTVKILRIHRETSTALHLLTAYEGEPYFYRTSIDLATSTTTRTVFGDTSMGAIGAIFPVFAEKTGEQSFILVGDQLGCVRVFPWDGKPSPTSSIEPAPRGAPTSSVLPVRQFEAYTRHAITALTWTPSVLLTGSTNGAIKAFDSLTFAPLRDFTSTSSRISTGEDVRQIIVDRDFFVASVNNRVVAWRGESVKDHGHGFSKGKRVAKTPNGIAKWHREFVSYHLHSQDLIKRPSFRASRDVS